MVISKLKDATSHILLAWSVQFLNIWGTLLVVFCLSVPVSLLTKIVEKPTDSFLCKSWILECGDSKFEWYRMGPIVLGEAVLTLR